MKNNDIADCLNKLTCVWLNWNKADTKARSSDVPITERKAAVDDCENLIAQRHEAINKIDFLFDSKIENSGGKQ